jgi:uncharacterized phiE125 gp8 family phage protein
VDIIYTDAAGDEQTVPPADYELAGDACRPVAGAAWPEGTAVRVSWVAGTGTPEPARQAILLLVGHWYMSREAAAAGVSELPLGVAALLAPLRRVGV